jgi:DNA-binding transcriptional regulator PaaX
MTKTSVDARRHIREWSEFFQDLNEVSKAAIEEFIKSCQKSKYRRQSLKRLIERGFLKDEGSKIKKTKSGLLFFKRRYHNDNKARSLKQNGKWYILSFDIPMKFNRKRAALRRILHKYKFVPLQRSVWVGAHQMSKDVWEFIVENDLEKCCVPMVVDIIEGEDRLKKLFKGNNGNF